MVYFLRGKEVGEEDAYNRVFDGEHRPLVKEAFNAMVQASTTLTKKPRGIDLSEVDMDWPTLRQAVLDAHWFFKGHGNHLQYIDSIIAEQVMLQFAKYNHPVLPIHDSFIMHYAFGDMGELEEAMRRAFYHHFKKDIKVKGEIGIMLPGSNEAEEVSSMTIDEILATDPDYSQWEGRDRR